MVNNGGIMIDINFEIKRLINYGIKRDLIEVEDIDIVLNDILDILNLDEYIDNNREVNENHEYPIEILENILIWAVENNRVEDMTSLKDVLDSKLMATMMPKQSELIRRFYELYKLSPEKSTDMYYRLNKESNYIRTSRIEKNEAWLCTRPHGDIEITINLSKPEKDPKEIEKAKDMVKSSYPKCLLCKENAGYRGRIDHPGRKNHRIIPVELGKEKWYLQYSPYSYYNEHAIVFSSEHKEMKISKESFGRLLDFVEIFPHYFVGSNADLPIVGGSILSHDHFQGGKHEFPMAKASVREEIDFGKGVFGGIVDWYMSVIRLYSHSKNDLLDKAAEVLEKWKSYTDEKVEIYSHTGETRHNTITPIVRKRGDLFEIDLVLRNNRRSEKHPMGIYHPHKEYHHIKKENIGLIEVMGLAVLPGRLKKELLDLEKHIKNNEITRIKEDENLSKHYLWIESIKDKFHKENIREVLEREIGEVFAKVLECSAVFKKEEEGRRAFDRFINEIK